MYSKVFAFVTLFVLAPTLIVAQVIEPNKSRSGSIYSGIGFGAPVAQHSSYTNGMGLSGIATYSPFSASLSNPAQWGMTELTQAQVSLGLTNFEARDNLSTATNSQFSFDSFQFLFPVIRNELGISLSFTPVTRSDFARVEQGSFLVDGSSEPIQYASNTIGSGGINRAEIGFGYQVNSNISLGYAISAYLLTINDEITTSFSDPQFERNNQPSLINENLTGAGLGNRFGIFTRFNQPFGSQDRLKFSSTVSLPVAISTDRSVNTFRTINNTQRRTQLDEASGNIQLPLEFNSGLTYYLNPYHSFSAEYLFQNWDEAEYSFSAEEQSFYKDRSRVGIGYQYQPFLNQQASGFFSNFRYSVGASYDNGFLSISDQNIETAMLHAGLTIPSSRNRSSIDLSFNYGVRGTDSNNLVKENIWGFKLSLNLAEFMFLRQRFQ